MKNQKLSYVYGISAIVCWSTAASAFKIGLRQINFVQLLFFSSLTAVIVLFLVLLCQGKFKHIFSYGLKQYFVSAGVGFLNPFLYYLVLLKAY